MAKIHVVDVIGSTQEECNTAKAYDGVSNVYHFIDGKWKLWSHQGHPGLLDQLMINHVGKRARHTQPVGMFIRVED